MDSENDKIFCPYRKCKYKCSSERVLQLHLVFLHAKSRKNQGIKSSNRAKNNEMFNKEPNLEFEIENPTPASVIQDPLNSRIPENAPVIDETNDSTNSSSEDESIDDTGHQCHYCNKKFPFESYLKKHIIAVHEESNKNKQIEYRNG